MVTMLAPTSVTLSLEQVFGVLRLLQVHGESPIGQYRLLWCQFVITITLLTPQNSKASGASYGKRRH